MLDLIPNNSRVSDIRDGVQYEHGDPFDLSLFTDRAVFERQPVLADVDGLPQRLDSSAQFITAPPVNWYRCDRFRTPISLYRIKI